MADRTTTARIRRVCRHFDNECSSPGALIELPPTVQATKQLSEDPISFLMAATNEHPEVFAVERPGNKYVVVADPKMFDDVLGDEDVFGMPSVFLLSSVLWTDFMAVREPNHAKYVC